MYTLTKNIKILSSLMMISGFIALAYGFYSAPHSVEEAKEMVSSHDHDNHGPEHEKDYYDKSAQKENKNMLDHNEGHEMSHDEHVYHQLSNRPWSALYVSALFFFLKIRMLFYFH